MRDADLVVDVLDTHAAFGKVLDLMLHTPLHHRSFQRNDATPDFDRHLACVDKGMIHETLADVFLQALI